MGGRMTSGWMEVSGEKNAFGVVSRKEDFKERIIWNSGRKEEEVGKMILDERERKVDCRLF